MKGRNPTALARLCITASTALVLAALSSNCSGGGPTYLGPDASASGGSSGSGGASTSSGGDAGSSSGATGGSAGSDGTGGSGASNSGGDGGSAGSDGVGGSAGSDGTGGDGAGGSTGAGGSAGSDGAGGDGAGGTAGAGGANTGGSGGGVQDPITKTFGEGPDTDHSGVTTDTKIRGDNVTQSYNYGAGWHITPDASPITYGLLRFDISAIPLDAVVISATLELWTATCTDCQANPGSTVALYELYQSWDEGNYDSDVTPTTGTANWNYRTTTGITSWASPGAAPPSRASSPMATFAPTALNTKYAITLPTSVVQTWVNMPSANCGVLLMVNDPSVTDGVAFVSSENADGAEGPTKRPRLIVQYELP